jgi:predicted ABC-type ATPase
VWLRSVELAIERVAERVRRGGHDIPGLDLRRRYQRGINNLFELYIPLADTWAVYDNSEQDQAALLATGAGPGQPKVARPDLWHMLLESQEQK